MAQEIEGTRNRGKLKFVRGSPWLYNRLYSLISIGVDDDGIDDKYDNDGDAYGTTYARSRNLYPPLTFISAS